LEELNTIIAKHLNNPVLSIIRATAAQRDLSYNCCPLLVDFVKNLKKDIAPASLLCPPSIWVIVETAIAKEVFEIDELRCLEQKSPSMYLVATAMSKFASCRETTSIFIELLRKIVLKSKRCFQPPANWISDSEDVANPLQSVHDPFEECLRTGAFFPNRTIIRKVTPIHLKKETSCEKVYKASGNLGGGLILVWCAEHKECIGFYVLPSAESLTYIHQMLVSRFIQMPELIIYDNGCALNEYILNRSPQLFKNTVIVSDGFHWKNHTTCASYFNSKMYPATIGNELLTRLLFCTARAKKQIPC
jgi:hypothetical protein